MLRRGIFVGIFILALVANVSADSKKAVELDKQVTKATEFKYTGQKQLTKEESELLLADTEHKKKQAEKDKDCPPDGVAVKDTPKKDEKTDPKKDDWKVVFLMRLSVKSDNSTKATTVPNEAEGAKRFAQDLPMLTDLASKGKLDVKKLDATLEASGNALKHDPKAAMAYVAALGERLVNNYGDSKAGQFVTRVEQYGRMAAGDSVGQCSDIHYAMLKAYKKLTGNPKAKAYLVNFQTGKSMHHTDLVIEEGGQLFVVNYGEITAVPATRPEALRQSISAGSGLAYRVFGEGSEETDKMLAHIDSPMGMFLREVSTGTASYNPFQMPNYSIATAGIAKSGGTHVQVFFGELGGGDVITGVAVNLAGKNQLPAGFTLESHLGGAIAYAHKKFQTDTKSSSLHSEVLYINTGLGLVSPKLELGNFTFSARTDIALEGGVWMKQYNDGTNKTKDPMEGDVNIVNNTKVTAEYKQGPVKVVGTAGVELMPSFKTAFPKATDGSSAEGLGSTLGILPNRVTVTLDGQVKITPNTALFAGGTYQYTGLGPVGEARVGVIGTSWAARTYLRGAFDRDRTPAFVPGATRSVGAAFDWCMGEVVKKLPICVSAEAQKSLEDSSWQMNTGIGGKF